MPDGKPDEPPTQVRLLRSTGELEAFLPQWRELWQADPESTPFQSPEWLLPWWHAFGCGQSHSGDDPPELRLAVLTSGPTGKALGLLPFYRYTDASRLGLPGTRKLLLLGVGTSDYLDGLFAPPCTTADVLLGLRTVYESGGFDTLNVGQLRPESLLVQALGEWDVPGLQRRPTDTCGQMPAVPLAGLPVRIRRNAMYYRNRAERLGELTYTVAEACDCEAAFADLERLHSERWQARGEAGVLADPAVLAWHREALPRLATAGTLRLGTLRLRHGDETRGEVLGVLYSLVDPLGRTQRTQYFYLTAFSTAHAELRPGTLLLAYAIEHAANEGVLTIDMLRGEEAYKELWHLERTPTCGFSLDAPQGAAILDANSLKHESAS